MKMGKEKRSATIYARVRPSMKDHVKFVAELHEVSESEALDAIIEFYIKLMGNRRKK